jgi:molybdate transport system substrate-binding protein
MRRLRLCLVVLAALLVAPLLPGPAGAAERLVVFAAASTTEALGEALERFEAATGVPTVASFAASSTLATQIARGAPADLYVSADADWMDHLAAAGALRADTRRDLLGNRLVLVTAAGSDFACDPSAGCDLAAALGTGRLAIGDPAHVPAGRYARQALQSLGQWDAVAPKLAPAADVRGALALVARGETPAGIVYATDAALLDDVRVVAALPADSHAPVVYPVAVVADSTHPQAERLLGFLAGPEARAIFARHGFAVAAPPAPGG